MSDLVETGVDGLFIDTCASLEKAQELFGGKIFLLGNVDCRILTEGKYDDIRKEVERCTNVGKKSNGYILNVSGHIMNEIPSENLKSYFECAKALR
jgi:uroporphyrinogen-III decarboxylase